MSLTDLHDGDVLLFRSSGRPLSEAISVAGRSPYSHAGIAARWGGGVLGDWMCLETLQGHGGRATLLADRVAASRCGIDVFRDHLGASQRHQVVAAMRRIIGKPYGWWALGLAALSYSPLLRWLFRPSLDDRANGRPLFCSAAVSHAYRAAGIDLVPNLADHATTPGDLARSALLEYRFTLSKEVCDAPHEAA